MKTLILSITLTLSFNALAGEWTTAGLHDNELEAIDTASQEQMIKLSSCMDDEETHEINDTACINEVFGDVF